MKSLHWIGIAAGLLLAAQAAWAQAPAPYQGQQNRDIKALSADDIRSLSAGEGMGLAKSAELNRYPGPSHVLQLAVELKLTAPQRNTVQAIFDRMKQQAVATGNRIVAAERDLDQSFATRAIDEAKLKQKVAAIAALQGELRTIHLQAHLQTLPVLTPEQVAQYDMLRGYDAGGQGGPSHGRSHRGF